MVLELRVAAKITPKPDGCWKQPRDNIMWRTENDLRARIQELDSGAGDRLLEILDDRHDNSSTIVSGDSLADQMFTFDRNRCSTSPEYDVSGTHSEPQGPTALPRGASGSRISPRGP